MKREFKSVRWEVIVGDDKTNAKSLTRDARKDGALSCPWHYVIKLDGTIEAGRSLVQPAGIPSAPNFNPASGIAIAVISACEEPYKDIEPLMDLLKAIELLFPDIGKGDNHERNSNR